MANNTYSYAGLGTVPASASWANYQVNFTVPANVQSVTMYHLLNQVGYLTIDQASLVQQ
jgi:hypothetical protein